MSDAESGAIESELRTKLLARCTFSDRDCVDMRVRDTCTPRPARESAPWPCEGHACDFCGSWSSLITTCGVCHRWLGLDCACATPAAVRHAAADRGHGDQTTIDERADVLCERCANVRTNSSSSVPLRPTNYSEGRLRRIVFVLEPAQMGAWTFHMARRITIPLLEVAGRGTVLVYGVECTARESSWLDAFALVRRFAERPRAHLPPDCRYYSHEPVPIDIVLGMHSMAPDDSATQAYLDRGLGRSNCLRWWCEALGKHALTVPTRRNRHRLPISTLYWFTCDLFASRVCASSERLLGALADKYALTVKASDGYVMPFQQFALIASHIIASVNSPQPPLVPAPLMCFRPYVVD